MNSKKIVNITKDKIECTCMKCLKEFPTLRKITISELGYGSSFDGTNTEVHLCEDCYKQSNPSIWSMEVHRQDYCEEYVHEDEMLKYIEELPIQSKELVWNTLASGWNSDMKLDAQDWIDYELDELPHEKCKTYGLYSVEEIKAYKERFPKCEYVYNTVWEDGSKGSHCAMQPCTHGEYGGTVGLNYSTYCYECRYYKERVTPIRDIKGEDKHDYDLYVLSKVIAKELEQKFNIDAQ